MWSDEVEDCNALKMLQQDTQDGGRLVVAQHRAQVAEKNILAAELAMSNVRGPVGIDYYVQSRKWHEKQHEKARRWRLLRQETKVLVIAGREGAAERAEAASPGANGVRMSGIARVVLGSTT